MLVDSGLLHFLKALPEKVLADLSASSLTLHDATGIIFLNFHILSTYLILTLFTQSLQSEKNHLSCSWDREQLEYKKFIFYPCIPWGHLISTQYVFNEWMEVSNLEIFHSNCAMLFSCFYWRNRWLFYCARTTK